MNEFGMRNMTYNLNKYNVNELGNAAALITDISYYFTLPPSCCPTSSTDLHDSTYIFMRNDADGLTDLAV